MVGPRVLQNSCTHVAIIFRIYLRNLSLPGRHTNSTSTLQNSALPAPLILLRLFAQFSCLIDTHRLKYVDSENVISAYKIIILRQSAISNGSLLRQAVISTGVASISYGKEPVCMVSHSRSLPATVTVSN